MNNDRTPPGVTPDCLAWEAPRMGAGAFFQTYGALIARPRAAFSLPPRGGWLLWAAFALFCWLMVLVARYLMFRFWFTGPVEGGADVVLLAVGGLLLQAAFYLPLYSWAVQITLRLMLKGAPAPGFLPIFRLVCYSQVSSAALLLPMVGMVAHVIWNVVLIATGLAAGLGLERRLAIRGAVFPTVAFFLLGLLLSMAAGF